MSDEKLNGTAAAPAGADGEPTPIIFLDDIRVTFKTRTGSILHPNKVQAVRGLTLKLMPGQTLGIVGESGCGKSTTANVMCGLQQPTSGRVFFKGKDVTKRTAAERRLIGRVISVVFQDPATALNARMSVHDQLMDPLVVHKIGDKASREARVQELIEMVGLPGSVLDALPGQLSGGQRQRVAIGRAIVRDPQVFLMDEPLSNLDAKLRLEMRSVIRHTQKSVGITTVYVTHDQEEAMAISDKIAVMNAGVIQHIGRPREIYQRPKNVFVATFIGRTNLISARIQDGELIFADGYRERIPALEKAEDQEVQCSIRPEEFIICKDGTEGIRGTVKECTYLGLNTHYYIDTDEGDTVEIVEESSIEDDLKEGQPVLLKIKREKVNIFDKAGNVNLVRSEAYEK